jgi:hypothetical protein
MRWDGCGQRRGSQGEDSREVARGEVGGPCGWPKKDSEQTNGVRHASADVCVRTYPPEHQHSFVHDKVLIL